MSRIIWLAPLLGLSCAPSLQVECGADQPCPVGVCIAGLCVDRDVGARPPTDATPDAASRTDAEGGCAPGEREVCGLEVGRCTPGSRVCSEDRAWGPCEGANEPLDEACNFVDDDCDGETDEGALNECGTCGPVPQEICGGGDEDCDGRTDEVSLTCGVEVGACAAGTRRCVDGAFGECEGAGEPGTEACNGVDDDCDGVVDEALDVACGSDRGTCRAGLQRCVEGETTACEGAVDPVEESCEEPGDEDCDGSADEGCRCDPLDERACGESEVGACHLGLQRCVDEAFGACVGAQNPQPESCNGLDDDCDGTTDEALQRPCGPMVEEGQCRRGVEVCADGLWGECEGAVTAGEETCDGIDQDCDGRIDEEVTRPCGDDTGACAAGVETCEAGRFGDCVGAVGPVEEICNGVDDDCDGVVDDLTRPCGRRIGACEQGVERCLRGGWGECVGGVVPAAETCDGFDEDCDGLVDEEVSRDCEAGGACPGLQTCSDGAFGACVRRENQEPERCNGRDDDCDGRTDEGVADVGEACAVGLGACRADGVTVCRDGEITCGASPGAPGDELCNGDDDDCDGSTDEVFPNQGDVCEVGVGACRNEGALACINARPQCDGEPRPSVVERCNNIDDDCDRALDESFPEPDEPCAAGLGLCRREGDWRCAGGDLVCDAQPAPPINELCNGFDDDCDGRTDEDFPERQQGCSVGTGACRVEGQRTCVDGQLGCSEEPGEATPEVCDNVDNDCDGAVDQSGGEQIVCQLPNATAGCVMGECVGVMCESRWLDVDGVADNGCERGCDAATTGADVAGVDRVGTEAAIATSPNGNGYAWIDEVNESQVIRFKRGERAARVLQAARLRAYQGVDLVFTGGDWVLAASWTTGNGGVGVNGGLDLYVFDFDDGAFNLRAEHGQQVQDPGPPRIAAAGDRVVVTLLSQPGALPVDGLSTGWLAWSLRTGNLQGGPVTLDGDPNYEHQPDVVATIDGFYTFAITFDQDARSQSLSTWLLNPEPVFVGDTRLVEPSGGVTATQTGAGVVAAALTDEGRSIHVVHVDGEGSLVDRGVAPLGRRLEAPLASTSDAAGAYVVGKDSAFRRVRAMLLTSTGIAQRPEAWTVVVPEGEDDEAGAPHFAPGSLQLVFTRRIDGEDEAVRVAELPCR